MQKRGLAGIISIVILILIAVIAISLIWNFVRPVIVDVIGDKSKQQYDTTIQFPIPDEDCNY